MIVYFREGGLTSRIQNVRKETMKRISITIVMLLVFLLSACSLPQAPAVPGQAETPAPFFTATPTAPSSDPAPQQPQQPTPDPDGEAFDRALAEAFETKNMAALRSMMRDRFSIAYLNLSLEEVSSEQALRTMSEQVLNQGSMPAARFGTDVTALLNGADPFDQWGPVTRPVRALHVMGLGHNAGNEAVLVIGRDDATGNFYWHGILLPREGYFTDAPPVETVIMPTDVTYVMAKENVNVRTGPSLDYRVEGQIFAGQIAQVHGVSQDGGWWFVACTNQPSGVCWVSADPSLTEPVTDLP
jgi:uncharacterized protein YgiM (DUF1202 family)